MKTVLVQAPDGRLLEPCHPARARELVRNHKAAGKVVQGRYVLVLREAPPQPTVPTRTSGSTV